MKKAMEDAMPSVKSECTESDGEEWNEPEDIQSWLRSGDSDRGECLVSVECP